MSEEPGSPQEKLPRYLAGMTKRSPFWYFKTAPVIIGLVVLLRIHFSLSLRNVEDLLLERAIEISDETVRHCWNRFGPKFAAEMHGQRCKATCARGSGCGDSLAFV